MHSKNVSRVCSWELNNYLSNAIREKFRSMFEAAFWKCNWTFTFECNSVMHCGNKPLLYAIIYHKINLIFQCNFGSFMSNTMHKFSMIWLVIFRNMFRLEPAKLFWRLTSACNPVMHCGNKPFLSAIKSNCSNLHAAQIEYGDVSIFLSQFNK